MNARGVLVALIALAGSTATTRAAEPDTALKALLDAAWTPSIRGLQSAQSQYGQLIEKRPGDLRVTYAYALVLIKNRRYEDATKSLGEILTADKTHRPARRARIWLALLTRKHQAGLDDMVALAEQFPANPGGADEPQWCELAEFLGRMLAFLEGPVESPPRGDVLADDQAKIVARLAGARLAAYNRGFRETSDRFSQLTQQRDETQAQAKVDAAEQKQRDREDLDTDRQEFANAENALTTEAEKLTADKEKSLGLLQATAKPLQESLPALENLAAVTSIQLANEQNQAASLFDLADNDSSSNVRNGILVQAAASNLRIRMFSDTLNQTLLAIGRAKEQLAALELQRRNVVARFDNELAKLNKRHISLQKSAKRLTYAERRLQEPVTGNTPRARTLSANASALPTYYEFPFETERQRVLAP